MNIHDEMLCFSDGYHANILLFFKEVVLYVIDSIHFCVLFLGFDRGCYLDDAVFLYADNVSRAFHAVRPSQGVGVISHAARRVSLVDVVFDVVDHVFWNDGGNAGDGDGVWDFTCDGGDLAVVGAVDMGIVVVVIHHYSPFSFLSSHIRAEDRPAFFSLCFFSE